MTVGLLTQVLASVLFLLPVAVVVRGMATPRTSLDQLALWIPATVATDLLTCLLLARLVRLDIAFLISRALWLVGGGLWIARRRNRIGRPEALDARRLAVLAGAGIVAFAFSSAISRDYSIWDRQFHIPLVATIRGQQLPFLNVFQPDTVLHYHFAGDVLAAGIQTFSGMRVHASLALALVHDLNFALAAVSVAAMLLAASPARPWMVMAALSIFFMGPLALLRTGLGNQLLGYSFLSLLCMSFRPHVNLAILLLVGVLAALLRAADGRARPAETVPVVGSCVIALGITDEPSAAVAGLALGATWLFFHEIFGPKRWQGLLALVAIGAGIVGANLVFEASLAPGGPVQDLRLVPWRSPGYSENPLPLSGSEGRRALWTDLGAFLAVYAAVIGCALRSRHRGRMLIPLFLGVVLLGATFCLTRLDLGGMHLESHRFATICEILFGTIAAVLLARLPSAAWERIPIIGAVAIAAVSTIFWMEEGMGPPEEYFTNYADCREAADASLFEEPQPTYIPRAAWFRYAGCRPVFSPGLGGSWDTLFVGGPDGGRAAFATLSTHFVRPHQSITVACPVGDQGDPACRVARARKLCKPSGTDFETCALSAADRATVLALPW